MTLHENVLIIMRIILFVKLKIGFVKQKKKEWGEKALEFEVGAGTQTIYTYIH